MRHIKRNIALIIGLVTLAISTSVVFAAFIFSRVIEGTASTGNFYKLDKKIINYAFYADQTPEYMANLATSNLTELLSNLNERKTDSNAVEVDSNSIICYATQRTGHEDEKNEYHLPNLNQIGFNFECTTTIDAYVRVHFQDAWISKKTYNSGKVEQAYIIKDQLNGVYEQLPSASVNEDNCEAYFMLSPKGSTASSIYSSSAIYYTKEIDSITNLITYKYVGVDKDTFDDTKASTTYYILTAQKPNKNSFNPSALYFKFTAESPFKITKEGWYYDSASNVAYKKQKIDVDEQSNQKEKVEFDFDIDRSYFYKERKGSFHEAVKIQLSFFVEVVQANRVQEIWHVDPEKLV